MARRPVGEKKNTISLNFSCPQERWEHINVNDSDVVLGIAKLG